MKGEIDFMLADDDYDDDDDDDLYQFQLKDSAFFKSRNCSSFHFM